MNIGTMAAPTLPYAPSAVASPVALNKLVRVVEHKHVCAHCGEAVWCAVGALPVEHVCDERRLRARTHADVVLRRL